MALRILARSVARAPVARAALCRAAPLRVPVARAFSHSDFASVKHVEVPEDEEGIKKMIAAQVADNKVMLYMKGTPAQPQCGFSQQLVRMLHATGVEFSSVNVLEDPGIREGIKDFSQWPTIPQLYVGGEFVGGCDIVTAAFQSGELDETLKAAGAVAPPTP